MKDDCSFPREKIKILLLEGIHQVCAERFSQAGYTAELQSAAMKEEELIEAISGVHILGIRSKSVVTPRVLAHAKNLLAIGCFCIGTDQVALEDSAQNGVPVFNAPFSNTRSVAELAIAEVIMLARKAAYKSQLLHGGTWDKSALGCCEVRNKSIGIVGYGHIGPQVGLLAEALGMKVYYFDVVSKLPLGNATPVDSLEQLCAVSDFITLHVPETPETVNLFSTRQFDWMRQGSYLLNLSRGRVVDIDALRDALRSGRIAGAALDVFPEEPRSNDEQFQCALSGMPNVILTPHIGGSTLEAQRNIGIEVATTLIKYLETGSSTGAVNFPQVELPRLRESHRILNIHRNEPGVLGTINSIVADLGGNIAAQYLETRGDIGYLIIDIDRNISATLKKTIDELDLNIRTRIVH